MNKHLFLVTLSSVFVMSCGGGGGDNNVSEPVNSRPILNIPNNVVLFEGQTTDIQFNATDDDNDTLSFSLSGDDASYFSIANNTVSFNQSFDFENPTDSNLDNVYSFNLVASDGTTSVTQSVNVTLQDAFEGRIVDGPVSGSKVFFDKNNNFIQDNDEQVYLSDEFGYFAILEANTFEYNLVAIGGFDTATNQNIDDTVLAFPPIENQSFANVTPLSTLVSVSEEATVASLLSAVSDTITLADVLSQDTWEQAENDESDAQAIQTVNTQIISIVNSISKLTQKDNITTSKNVIEALVSLQSTMALSSLNEVTTISSIIKEIIVNDGLIEPINSNVIAALSTIIATTNNVIKKNETNITSDTLSQVVAASQTTVPEQVEALMVGTISLEEFIEEANESVFLDTDADGVLDSVDAFPFDATETVDTDLDGIGDNTDTDDDNDGVLDDNDVYPLDGTQFKDTTPPVILLNGLPIVTLEIGSDYLDAGAIATDNVDGILNPNIQSNINTMIIGSYSVTFSISDSSGNDAQPVSRIVNVVDITSPQITLNGSQVVTIEVGDDYIDAGATAIDNVDGNITPKATSNVNTAIPGSYSVTFSISDSSGNDAQSLVRTVIVESPSSEVDIEKLTWGKHEYLRPQIERAQASVVGMGEFFLGAAGVMLSDRHVLAKVAVITRGLEVDKNRKVVNIWGEISAMKEVYWANPGDKESLCIIELETPFQNFHVPVIAQQDASEGDLVYQVSHSAHVSNGNKGWSVSFGESMADFNMSDGLGHTTIPPLTAYANMDGNYGAGVFNEQGELIGLASGADFGDIISPWYIPEQPLHNTIMNSLETRSNTLTYNLSSIKKIMEQINLVPIPGGKTELPLNQLDVFETVLSDEELSVIQPLSEKSKNSVVTISEGGCSGTLIADDLILTNAHCVVHNRHLDIGFKGGEQIRGDALALNELIDLAVIKLRALPPSNYAPAKISKVGFKSEDIGYGVGSPGALWGKFGGWQVSPMKARGYRRGDYIMSGYILPGSSGSGVFDSNGDLSSVLWGSGYETDPLLVEGPLDRQDPHIFDLSPSSHKSANVTMADFPTLVEFATRFNGQSKTENEYIYDSLVDKNGKIYVVGRTYRDGSNQALITRLTNQNQWDSNYILDVAIPDSSAVSIEQSKDGLFYVLLQSITGPQQIIRLLEDGSLDYKFANNGVLNLDIGLEHLAIDMTLDHLDRLIVTGTVLSENKGANIYLARWNALGQIDMSFNNKGWVELDVAGYGDYPKKVLVQGNHILVGGHTTLRNQSFAESDILLARFNESGLLDTVYGEDGLVITQLREYDHEQLSDMVLQSDGKLIITGQNRGFGRVTVLRFLPNGLMDLDFGEAGVVMLEDRYEIDVGVAVLATDNGDIVVAGNLFKRTSNLIEPGTGYHKIVIYRLTEEGNLNLDFAKEGRVILHSGNDDYAHLLKSLANGDILIIGNSHKIEGAVPSLAVISEKGDVSLPLNSN